MRNGLGLLIALFMCPAVIGALPQQAAAQTVCPSGTQAAASYGYDGLGRLTSQTVACTTPGSGSQGGGGGGTQQAPLPTWALSAMAAAFLGIGRSKLKRKRSADSSASEDRS